MYIDKLVLNIKLINWFLFQYLEDLKRKRARIIIADVYDEVARSVMCEAYKLDMTAREGYVWFLPLWLSSTWYNTTYYNHLFNETVNCTTEMMITVSKINSFTVNPELIKYFTEILLIFRQSTDTYPLRMRTLHRMIL